MEEEAGTQNNKEQETGFAYKELEMDKIKLVEQEYTKKQIPAFKIGDTVRVMNKILEGDRVRLHPFEGIVIAKKEKGLRSSFTVRKISYGEGVERVFPTYSPQIEQIDVLHQGRARRAKLYYLRKRLGKAATKIKAATK